MTWPTRVETTEEQRLTAREGPRDRPDRRGTVTDLLIGDLFDEKVDKVWAPMESLYPPDKAPIVSWNAVAYIRGGTAIPIRFNARVS